MNIKILKSENIEKYIINDYKPLIKYDENIKYNDANVKPEFNFYELDGYSYFEKNFDIKERIIGFGEKAKHIIKNRERLIFYNYDQAGYTRDSDPLYVSVPFFISVSNNITGYFINNPSRIEIDIGLKNYNKIEAKIDDSGFELFVIHGNSIEDVIKTFTEITGRTFVPPRWALGHQISRYSYYPDRTVINVVKEYRKYIDVSAVYLDIDYMDDYKIFTFDKERFPDIKKFKEELNAMGTRLITIIDPGFKIDQLYKYFINGIGKYVINSNNEIYISRLWPGNCAFLNFLDADSYNYWKSCVKEFAENVDGIWLDMNEPALFNDERTISGSALHYTNNGFIKHSKIHNAYSLLEAKATYEALKEIKDEFFILSRSGYPGIQRYAAIWTGDNKASDDDLKLQISMIVSMNLSGIMICGCDLGGFFGYSSPELISRYYKAAMLFPFFRNHKVKEGNDQEIYLLPEKYRNEIIETVNERYKFIDYIYSIIKLSSLTGVPVIRPIFYNDPYDETAYYIEDEYMLGDVLYAPDISDTEVYLPSGRWINITTFEEFNGKSYIKRDKNSIFIKLNSAVIYDGSIIIYGNGDFKLYYPDELLIKAGEDSIIFSRPVKSVIIPLKKAKATGDNIKYEYNDKYTKISGNLKEIKFQ
ncbi:alpha-glucosidase MalA [Picrophilus oshimae]|uniref:Alpha-glucosidase n=1 Tax=Picrophilus torridus (strain ATCC 700027 / DSM 9790 / JCM 10055 / NBRC 100828 / KAW 2/3) TaxID=1122961 RepID=A0A8G2FXT5_PICTO|nr:alpha-glucosidase MalA [Picrophilus oshimae]SMD31460.1 alpha-glucosidase [Picrophilus oshimae DSM 9789]